MHHHTVPEPKAKFVAHVKSLFQQYHKVMLVTCENVNSTQMIHIRHDLMGKAELIFGKNSLMRHAIEELKEEKPEVYKLKELLYHGVGLVFTNSSFADIKKVIDANCVGSPARVGSIAPCQVVIQPQKTTLAPTQVNVLHGLNIQSKITKGTIEITSEKVLIEEGAKVGASEASFLSLLGILPFKYTLKVVSLFDNGNIYEPAILNISDDVLAAKFAEGFKRVTALAYSMLYVQDFSAPHIIGAAYRDIASVAVALDYPLAQIAELQKILADPEALAKAQAAAASSAPAGEAPAEEKKEEEEAAAPLGLDDMFGDW